MKVTALLVVAIFCGFVYAQNNNTTTGKFYFLSDWHVDPYYNPDLTPDDHCHNVSEIVRETIPFRYYEHRLHSEWMKNRILSQPDFNYGQYGCDVPIVFAEAALSAMQQVLDTPDFIIYTGDMSGHHLPTPDSRFTAINDTIALLSGGFPGVPIYPTLGNNDCYPDYYLAYWPNRPNEWLTKVWSSWSVYSAIPADQESNFVNGGYYSADMGDNIVLISLNTIYVCTGHNPSWSSTRFPDPAGMFAWLNQTLLDIQSQGKMAYIIGHIPPNGDWHSHYLDTYLDLIYTFQDVITAQLFGHTHRDEMHLITDSERGAPYGFWLQTPSLTPKDDNNPSFRIVDYDTTNWQIIDYTQYISDLLHTQRTSDIKFVLEYVFKELYEVDEEYITLDSMMSTISKLTKDTQLFQRWKSNYDCQYEDPTSRMEYFCEMYYPGDDAQGACEDKGPYQSPPAGIYDDII